MTTPLANDNVIPVTDDEYEGEDEDIYERKPTVRNIIAENPFATPTQHDVAFVIENDEDSD